MYVTSGHSAVRGECVCTSLVGTVQYVASECACTSLVGTVQYVVNVHMVDIVLRLFRLFGCVKLRRSLVKMGKVYIRTKLLFVNCLSGGLLEFWNGCV